MNITEEQFWETYAPIKNHLDDNACLDGCMYETYDEELEFVKSQPNNLIWTYCDDGDTAYLSSGFHFVNRLGYLIATKPFEGDYADVHLYSWDEEDDDE